MSLADNLGFLPNTRLKGESLSVVLAGVMFDAKAISVNRDGHCGAESRALLIFSSSVKVLC